MRRNLLLLAALVVIAVSYAFYWYSVADLVRRGILDWSAARRAEGFTVGWDRYVVSGFPFALRVSIEQPVFGQSGIEPGYAAQAPLLVGEARPWALDQWRVTAAYGARLAIQPGPARPAVTITAAALAGTVQPRQDGDAASRPGTAVTLAIDRIAIVGQSQPSITRAELQTVIPAHRVASHLETWLTASVNLIGVTLPQAVQPLGDTIERLTATVAVNGDIPAGPHREALAAWRDDGGTLEIGSFDLGWGKLQFDAKGTLALDATLQPIGALTALIRGYNESVDALVLAGSLKAGDAALAKVGLGLLAKQGPGGANEISAPLTLQNGYIFLGPARLARLPLFTWE